MARYKLLAAIGCSVVLAAVLGVSSRGQGSAEAAKPALPAWQTDPVWHDGLVEKATYSASKVIYGAPREYSAVFFTNKEQHDTKTWTKANGSKRTVEVFKHNQVETVPTPNYPYHFVTTSHLTVGDLVLTAYQQSSQEFCGTSFRQLLPEGTTPGGDYELETFSYMPESGHVEADLTSPRGRRLLPEDALPLALRGFPFGDGQTIDLHLLPTQKTNRAAPTKPLPATVRYAGRDEGDHKLELIVDGTVRGTYWFADDRQHVMTKYTAADRSQTYTLTTQERVDYWTIRR